VCALGMGMVWGVGGVGLDSNSNSRIVCMLYLLYKAPSKSQR